MINISCASNISFGPGTLYISDGGELNVCSGSIDWAEYNDVGVTIIDYHESMIQQLENRLKKIEDTLLVMGIEISEDEIHELL